LLSVAHNGCLGWRVDALWQRVRREVPHLFFGKSQAPTEHSMGRYSIEAVVDGSGCEICKLAVSRIERRIAAIDCLQELRQRNESFWAICKCAIDIEHAPPGSSRLPQRCLGIFGNVRIVFVEEWDARHTEWLRTTARDRTHDIDK